MVCLWSRFESLYADFPSVAKYPYVEDLLSVINLAAFIGLLALASPTFVGNAPDACGLVDQPVKRIEA
jgi:hypothetical protein